jgi:micrococcal nuclease
VAAVALATIAFLVPAIWFVLQVHGAIRLMDSGQEGLDAEARRPVVVQVIDGDTIEVRMDGRTEQVRLLGIDTPETKDPRKPVQCFGQEASDQTKRLLPKGTNVRLVSDVEERDRYDRLLAYVYRDDGLFVNLVLAKGGFADLLTYPPNVAHTAELQAAVDEARRDQRGLWQACGGPGRPA